MQNVRR